MHLRIFRTFKSVPLDYSEDGTPSLFSKWEPQDILQFRFDDVSKWIDVPVVEDEIPIHLRR